MFDENTVILIERILHTVEMLMFLFKFGGEIFLFSRTDNRGGKFCGSDLFSVYTPVIFLAQL